jgi:Fe-S-cluster-containing dehydrogenase component
MQQDRRTFVAEAGRWLMLTGAATIAFPFVASGEPENAPNYKDTDHWWGMIIDIEKCIGCGNCVRACKAENNVLNEEGHFRTWVERYQVASDDLDHPKVDSPNGGYDGFPELEPAAANVKSFFVPKLCNHCANSPCVQVCPVGATFESRDGVVLVDKSYCIGCRYIDERTNTVDKCDLCYHRITKGLTTACCEACPTGARQLVDLKNPKDPVHAFLKDNAVHVLKPQMATGAKVYYRDLDGAVR